MTCNDFYTKLAAELLRKPESEIISTERDIGKKMTHSRLYSKKPKGKRSLKIFLFITLPIWGALFLLIELVKAIWEDISEWVDNR